MKVGIIQSSYIPWRGYFDFIDEVDLFVFLEDVQYSKGSWRNRNRIKTQNGLLWLTVPVHAKHGKIQIRDVRIDNSKKWVHQHARTLEENYARAPYFRDYYIGFLNQLNTGFKNLSTLNIAITQWLMQQLEIHTPTMISSELDPEGKATDRLLDILVKLGADCYVSGPSAKNYLEESKFRKKGIRLEYKSYDYPDYPQLWGNFVSNVTVLDLLFNMGPDSRRFLKSRSPNEVAVP